jgi:hypothetical protein
MTISISRATGGTAYANSMSIAPPKIINTTDKL